MTKAELEHIQSLCYEWLQQPGVSQDSRMTIPSSKLSLHLHEAWRLIAPQKLQDAFVPRTSKLV